MCLCRSNTTRARTIALEIFADLFLSFTDLADGWFDWDVDRTCRFEFAAEYGTTCHDGRDITATSIPACTSCLVRRIFCASTCPAPSIHAATRNRRLGLPDPTTAPLAL